MAESKPASGRATGAGTLALLTAAAMMWGAAVSLGAWRDRHHALPPVTDEVLYLRGRRPCPRLALGFDAILADIYWIRAIQHFGSTKRAAASEDKSYRLLYPLLDLTTTLDPHFTVAYRFGSIFLCKPYLAAPAGPIRPSACSSAGSRQTDEVAVRAGRGLRQLLVAARLQGRRGVVQACLAY